MGRNPDLDKLDDLFAKGKDFKLSGKLYEERTGASLPIAKSYIKHRSALASKAAKLGFVITDVQENPVIERIVYFKKK